MQRPVPASHFGRRDGLLRPQLSDWRLEHVCHPSPLPGRRWLWCGGSPHHRLSEATPRQLDTQTDSSQSVDPYGSGRCRLPRHACPELWRTRRILFREQRRGPNLGEGLSSAPTRALLSLRHSAREPDEARNSLARKLRALILQPADGFSCVAYPNFPERDGEAEEDR